MALFQQSTKTVSAAVSEIADAAGASASTEMVNRALRSLQYAFQHFNNRANWNFALTDAPMIATIGPFTVSGVTAGSGQTSALAPASHGFLVDDLVQGMQIPGGTRVTATAAGSIGFDGSILAAFGTATATGSILAIRDMYAVPTDFKNFYSDRQMGSMTSPRQTQQRFYDRSISNELAVSTPRGYTLFPIGAKGKIRIVPPPANSDSIRVRYYRRMAIPTATGQTDALDIPQDYELYPVAWAKWHFLVDKGEGRGEQAQTWIAMANDGMKVMLADQTRQTDEDLQLIPGFYMFDPAMSVNSIRNSFFDGG